MSRCRFAAAAALLGMSACVPSNVVAVEDRGVVAAVSSLEWQPATAADIPGLYASASIEGPVALSLLKIYYLFSEDGSMAAAALVDAGDGPAFQVLKGDWEFRDGALILDGAEPAEIVAAPDHLRMSGAEGTVVLRREVVQ